MRWIENFRLSMQATPPKWVQVVGVVAAGTLIPLCLFWGEASWKWTVGTYIILGIYILLVAAFALMALGITVRNITTLENLYSVKKCPWCSESFRGVELGTRRIEHKVAGIPAYPRFLRVCPYCNHGVALDKVSRRWLVLAFPFLALLLIRAWTHKSVIEVAMNAGWLDWSLLGITLMGCMLASVTERYEKVEE
jgi:hypothetical protein